MICAQMQALSFLLLLLSSFPPFATVVRALAPVKTSRRWLEQLVMTSRFPLSTQTSVQDLLHWDDPQGSSWKMKRICLCGGQAVHGFVVEYENGSRRGRLLDNDQTPMRLYDENIERRGGVWFDITKRSDVIVKVQGYHLNPLGAPPYLCHTLEIVFESGQTIGYQGRDTHEEFQGMKFIWKRPQGEDNYYVNNLGFLGGFCTTMKGVRTLYPMSLDSQWM